MAFTPFASARSTSRGRAQPPSRAVELAGETEATETVATARWASNVSVEWDSSTRVAALVWDAADDVRVWSLYFGRSDSRNTVLPSGTTRYRIPGTVNGGSVIRVTVAGCLRSVNCGNGGLIRRSFRVGFPPRPSGFSATPGDREITLAWDAATDSSITHFEYEVDWAYGTASSHHDILDGDDNGSSAADETSLTVTTISRVFNHPGGRADQRQQLLLPAARRERPRERAMDREDYGHAAGQRGAGGAGRARDAAPWRRRIADHLGRPAGPQHHRVSAVGEWHAEGVAGHSRQRRDHHRRIRLANTLSHRHGSSGQCQRRRAADANHSRGFAGAGPAHGPAGRARKRPGDADLGRPGQRRLHPVLALHHRRRGDLDRHSRQPNDPAGPPHPLRRHGP